MCQHRLFSRTLCAILFGITAGVLALTGLQGFGFYVLTSALLSVCSVASARALCSELGVLARSNPISDTLMHTTMHILMCLLLLCWRFCSQLYLNVLFGSKAKDWFESSTALWTGSIAGNTFTYVLFWTLAYGLVHVY